MIPRVKWTIPLRGLLLVDKSEMWSACILIKIHTLLLLSVWIIICTVINTGTPQSRVRWFASCCKDAGGGKDGKTVHCTLSWFVRGTTELWHAYERLLLRTAACHPNIPQIYVCAPRPR